MTLKELQKLIKEEFDALTQEAEGDDLDVNVDSDEVAAEKNPEETLKAVFDMLKSYFEGDMEGEDMEGEDQEDMGEDMDEDMMDEVKDDDKKVIAVGTSILVDSGKKLLCVLNVPVRA